MNDVFETTERFGWGGTIKNRAGGALIGLILFVAAFPLLWWNEGRLARHTEMLAQIARNVVPFDPATDRTPAPDKPVLIQATPHVTALLADDDFGVQVQNALRLRRQAEMYQWQEQRDEQTHDRAGGGSERVTRYEYKKIWAPGRIDSAGFHKASEYKNPSNPVAEKKWDTADVRIGTYRLDPVWLIRLKNFQPVPHPAGWVPPGPWRAYDGWYYVANDPAQPAIGDVRIRFEYVPVGPLSMIGTIDRQRISPVDDQMMLIGEGVQDSSMLIKHRRQEEQLLSWGLRLLGFMMMAIGIQGIFVLLGAIGGIIPGFRMIASFFGGVVGVLVALAFSSLTIALAWFVARPLLTLGLGGLALCALLAAWYVRRGRAPITAKTVTMPVGVMRRD